MKLIVHGEPRTKKTSNETILLGRNLADWLRPLLSLPDKHLMQAILRRVKVVPNRKYRKWVRESRVEFDDPATVQLPMLAQPYNCKATFYRCRNIGDLVGYQQGIADLLQDKQLSKQVKDLHILPNDKWIRGWDGSRLEIDREKPRVVVELTPMAEHTIDLMDTLVESLKGEEDESDD